jgi:hypothetical protein
MTRFRELPSCSGLIRDELAIFAGQTLDILNTTCHTLMASLWPPMRERWPQRLSLRPECDDLANSRLLALIGDKLALFTAPETEGDAARKAVASLRDSAGCLGSDSRARSRKSIHRVAESFCWPYRLNDPSGHKPASATLCAARPSARTRLFARAMLVGAGVDRTSSGRSRDVDRWRFRRITRADRQGPGS